MSTVLDRVIEVVAQEAAIELYEMSPSTPLANFFNGFRRAGLVMELEERFAQNGTSLSLSHTKMRNALLRLKTLQTI